MNINLNKKILIIQKNILNNMSFYILIKKNFT